MYIDSGENMDNAKNRLLKRVGAFEYRFETIKNRLEKLQQLGVHIQLFPVSMEAIMALENKLRKKLSDEYVAFLFYIGSGRIGNCFYSPEQVWENYCYLKKMERYHFGNRYQGENIKLLHTEQIFQANKEGQDGIFLRHIRDGAIPIMEMGGIGMVLYIIRGELTGTVWEIACENGYYIVCKKYPLAEENEEFRTMTFIPWLEDKLKREIRFERLRKDMPKLL